MSKKSIKAVKRARGILGGTNAMARALGVKPPTVSEWIGGKRPVPAEKCPEIEELTNGEVMCEELLPGFNWTYLRASKQPEAA